MDIRREQFHPKNFRTSGANQRGGREEDRLNGSSSKSTIFLEGEDFLPQTHSATKRPFHARGGRRNGVGEGRGKVVCSCRSHQGFRKALEGRVRQATISSEMANQVRDGLGRRDLKAVDVVRGLGGRG
ncbi:hypothetical protein NPIL_365971 [Nephila pilipes]|uniref:Uncharacterized protein n=1 Tax=Nephila pilipes TaxID=299642 RepID=A0A8X6UFE0_NEPPI|nr:hypothetical protein NPIL_365971 [Nephila pilipes]